MQQRGLKSRLACYYYPFRQITQNYKTLSQLMKANRLKSGEKTLVSTAAVGHTDVGMYTHFKW